MSEDDREPIGKVSDYFWKRQVVRIEVQQGVIRTGDRLHVSGEYTDEVIDVKDMEIDDEPVDQAEEGEIFSMPLSMKQRVMLGDQVYPGDT